MNKNEFIKIKIKLFHTQKKQPQRNETLQNKCALIALICKNSIAKDKLVY